MLCESEHVLAIEFGQMKIMHIVKLVNLWNKGQLKSIRF